MQILQELPRLAAEQEQKCEELATKLMDVQEDQQKTEMKLERATKVCLLPLLLPPWMNLLRRRLLPSLLSHKTCCLYVCFFWCVGSLQHMPSHRWDVCLSANLLWTHASMSGSGCKGVTTISYRQHLLLCCEGVPSKLCTIQNSPFVLSLLSGLRANW